MKTAAVLRFGAIGDMVIVSPVFRLLKEDGYHVTAIAKRNGEEILRHNPFIDKFDVYEHDYQGDDLTRYFEETKAKYDRFINLTESIEGTLVKVPYREDGKKGAEELRKECNVNYYDRTLDVAGYHDVQGLSGELFFSPFEEAEARRYRKKYKDKFVVLWVLSGSSMHKAYPFAETVAKLFLQMHKDAVILTVGETLCELLEWSHERTKNYSGKWPIRKSLIMTKYADLVIGPDTGVMNAAGCFSTPKVLLLTGITEENICKHWRNCTAITGLVECYPCHKLHYELDTCVLDERLGTPACAAKIDPGRVYKAMESAYSQWKERRDGNFFRRRTPVHPRR